MSADSLLFVKSHVNAFTRKDGTFVAAHDDKRTAASVTAVFLAMVLAGGWLESMHLVIRQIEAFGKNDQLMVRG